MWLLPMIAERTADPVAFVESTVRGEIGYDSPEWIEAFQTISDLRSSGVLLAGSGATDYATMQLLFLEGKAAMTYNGTWLLQPLQAGAPTVPFDLHVAPLPAVDSTSTPHSTLAWAGFALPATGAANRDSVDAFLDYASRARGRRRCRRGHPVLLADTRRRTSGIHDPIAREFLPMLDDSITSLNWLWEPEIDAEIGEPVAVPGERQDRACGGRTGDRGSRERAANLRPQLLPLTRGYSWSAWQVRCSTPSSTPQDSEAGSFPGPC